MGLTRLVLVDPVDFPSYEAYRRAAGSDDVLGNAKVVSNLAEAVEGCVWVAGTSARLRTVRWPVLEPRACTAQAVEESGNGDVAIVFGRERTGLTNDELELCQTLVNIPTNPDYSSLNVASAVQVLSYELRLASAEYQPLQQPKGKGPEDVPASAEQVLDMYEHLQQMLGDVGFLGSGNPDIIMRRLKSVFNRARLTQREISILRGIYSAAQGRKSAR